MNKKIIVNTLLILLVLYRILLTVFSIYLPNINILVSYEILTQLTLIIFLIYNWNDLQKSYIDYFTVIIVVLFKPLNTILLAAFIEPTDITSIGNWGGNLLIFFSLVFVIWFISKYKKIEIYNKGPIISKIFIGVSGGMICVVITSFANVLQLDRNTPINRSILDLYVLFDVIQQMGFAGVAEEPIFRGIILSTLISKKIKPFIAIIFQSSIFMLCHIYYINVFPISFWFIVPFSGLCFGYIVYKTKSVGSGIIAHGIVNGTGNILSILLMHKFT